MKQLWLGTLVIVAAAMARLRESKAWRWRREIEILKYSDEIGLLS